MSQNNIFEKLLINGGVEIVHIPIRFGLFKTHPEHYEVYARGLYDDVVEILVIGYFRKDKFGWYFEDNGMNNYRDPDMLCQIAGILERLNENENN